MVDIPEVPRNSANGHVESQAYGIDRLLEHIFNCIAIGDSEDERIGLDLPALKFDRDRARALVQDFLDNRQVGRNY